MQSLGNLNQIGGESVEFLASETIVVNEGPSTYTARFPTWETIRKLGNLDGTGFTVTQQFDYSGNVSMFGNVTVTADKPSSVTFSQVGNVFTFGNIVSVEDYLNTRLLVDISDDISGNFRHLGNVFNTNSSDQFQYEINVVAAPFPEFTKSSLTDQEYDFFGSTVSNTGPVITQIANTAPRVITINQSTADKTVVVRLQDPNTSLSLNTTSTANITKTISNVGNVTLTLTGSIANLNSHLGTLEITKFANTAINRGVRNIHYDIYNTASNVLLETVTGNYWAAFEDPIHVGNDINYNDRELGSVYGRRQYTYPSRITFVGTHAGTGEPRFAWPMYTDSGNAAVKIFGLRLNSAEIEPGPLFDLGYSGASTNQAISTFDHDASIGTANSTGSNTVQVKINRVSNTLGAQLTVGCDAGDVFGVSTGNGLQFNQIYANGTVQLNTGNTYGTGDTHFVEFTTSPTSNVVLRYTGRDWFDQYTMFPNQWGINQAVVGDTYDIVVKGVRTTSSPQPYNDMPVVPEASIYAGRTNSTASGRFGGQLMTLNGQMGRLAHVCLQPRGAGGSGQLGLCVTIWRGLTILDNTEQQNIVHINARAHTAFGTGGNVSTIVRDHLATSNVAGNSVSHTISTTLSGNTAVSLSASNTVIGSVFGLNTSYTPEIFVRRGQTKTFVINNTTHPVHITDTLASSFNPGNVFGISNNGITSGTITLTPTSATPDDLYYTTNNVGSMSLNKGHIWVYDGDPVNNNARWGNVVPGAIALVRGGPTLAYLFYTRYTGSRTEGLNCSAGLYYRSVTVNADFSLTWGPVVVVQDSEQTGSIYGVQMSAQSTVIDNVTYVLCAIMPRAPATNPAAATMVGVRITN